MSIQTLSGTLKVVMKTEDKGSYKMQKVLIVKDGADTWVTVFGGGVNFNEKGNVITFEQGSGKKATITYNDQYKNYTVGEGCTISYELSRGNAPQSNENAPRNASAPSGDARTQQEAVKSMAEFLAGCHSVVETYFPTLDSETKRSYTMSLFIEGNKQGIPMLPVGEDWK